MNPLVIISLVIGAYWVGKRVAGTRPQQPAALPPSTTPPRPHVAPEGMSAEDAANAAAWEAVPFDVDVFFDEQQIPGDTYVTLFRPPPTDDGMSTAPGCQAIAVGHGFWARLEREAEPFVDAGMSPVETWDEIRWRLVPAIVLGAAPAVTASSCIDQDTEAGLLFEEEVLDRIASMGGMSLTAGATMPVPQANRSMPTIGEALAHQLGRRRYA